MIATCRTPGCVNEGAPIDVGTPVVLDELAVTESVVVCGPCGQTITDLTG